MNNIETVKLEHIFKTISNRKRMALLVYLFAGEASVCKTSNALNIPYKTTSRNLIYLQESGFLNKRTNNNQTYFSINNNASPNHTILLEMIKESCIKFDVRQFAKSLLKTLVKVDKEFGVMRKNYVMFD